MSSDELKPCPFCGSKVLYEIHQNVDGFEMPFMFCDSCKAMFTVEGSEDWVTTESDGFDELRARWNNRPKRVVDELVIRIHPRVDFDKTADEFERAAAKLREAVEHEGDK